MFFMFIFNDMSALFIWSIHPYGCQRKMLFLAGNLTILNENIRPDQGQGPHFFPKRDNLGKKKIFCRNNKMKIPDNRHFTMTPTEAPDVRNIRLDSYNFKSSNQQQKQVHQ